MGEPFVHRLRVRYAECDPQGVLFNANYLAYIDHTMIELWRAAYGGYAAMLDRGVDIVVAEANLRFRASARFDEEIAIEADGDADRDHERHHRLPVSARRGGAARGDGAPRVRRPRHGRQDSDPPVGASRTGAVAGPGAQVGSGPE